MAKICVDPRHSGVIEIMRCPVKTRAFDGWHMKHIDDLRFDELINAMGD